MRDVAHNNKSLGRQSAGRHRVRYRLHQDQKHGQLRELVALAVALAGVVREGYARLPGHNQSDAGHLDNLVLHSGFMDVAFW